MEWYEAIRDLGFPIVFSFYLLNRIEGKLTSVIEQLQQLHMAIHRMTNDRSG
ncbi:MAG: YvrJ family protein [Bacilli bacterium]